MSHQPNKLRCPLCKYKDVRPIQTPGISSLYFVCTQCDLHFLHPKYHLNPEEEKQRYLQHQNDVTDVRYQNFVRPLYEEIIHRFPSPAKGLDYGAGPGPVLTELLKKQHHQMSLYDPFFWPDTAVLNHPYDFVFACEVAEHFFDPATEFKKLRGLISKGGLVGLMTSLVTPQIDFATWYYRKDPTHVVFYSKQTVAWIARTFEFSKFEIANDRVILLSV